MCKEKGPGWMDWWLYYYPHLWVCKLSVCVCVGMSSWINILGGSLSRPNLSLIQCSVIVRFDHSCKSLPLLLLPNFLCLISCLFILSLLFNVNSNYLSHTTKRFSFTYKKNKLNGLALFFFFFRKSNQLGVTCCKWCWFLIFISRPNNTHLDFTLPRTVLYIIKTTKTSSTQTSNCACL